MMPMRRLVLFLIWLFTAYGSFAQAPGMDSAMAQPDSLPPPASITDFIAMNDSQRTAWFSDTLFLERVLSHDELMKYYHGDFADFLWYLQGFYVHDLGSYGKPITASFNGLPNTRWMVLLDDVPLNEPDVSWLNLNTISLENIERVEVYRGHAAGWYGAQGSAGTIRIISRRLPPDKAVTSLKFRSVFSSYEDIGVYFGRGLGERMQIFAGGSSKKTPGEQTRQGLSGGFISDIQRTRYAGRILFGGARYRISEDWAISFYAQSDKDRFDAYGRNRFGDRNLYEFTTVGGLRKDVRDDYHFSLTRQAPTSMLESRMYFTSIERISRNFESTVIPTSYQTSAVGFEMTYGARIGIHHIRTGAAYRRQSLDRIETSRNLFSTYGVYVADRMVWHGFSLEPSARFDRHSEFAGSRNASLNAAASTGSGWSVFMNAGYSEAFPSFNDVLWADRQSGRAAEPDRIPGYPFISYVDADAIRKEAITSLNGGVRGSRFLVFDRTTLGGFVHRVMRPIVYTPSYFNTDSMTIHIENGEDVTIAGAELRLAKRVLVFDFSFRPAVFQAVQSVRRGIPAFRAMFTGYTEFWTIRKNMKLTGFLAVSYDGSHEGYTFQDAPQIYYATPRNARGGWLFKTRATAEIGDFQLVYEAENIFRSRFTLLDGYDVTRQQWRFGIIWKLYN